MIQEDKELLLKDLCSRLPYGVKVNNEIQGDFKIYGICENFVFGRNETCHIDFNAEKIKPYLFPLSSMTEEQEKEKRSFDPFITEEVKTFGDWAVCLIDFYNKHHFDYHGLIEKGLAIDATGLNVY
jgi:hypothetical protein